jgi:hypothetical protein
VFAHHANELAGYLEAVDVEGMRRLWRNVAPHMPLHDDAGMVVAIHMARTQTEAVRFRHRAYSHAWLMEHGYPSLLSDELKPRAHRIYPVISSGVGIAVRSKYAEVRCAVEGAMRDAVLNAEAAGRLTDAPFVKARMSEARTYAVKKLFGRR